MNPGCIIRLLSFEFSSLFLHVDLVTTYLMAGFQVYLLALGSVYIGQSSMILVGRKLDLVSQFFVFSWLIVLGRWNQ